MQNVIHAIAGSLAIRRTLDVPLQQPKPRPTFGPARAATSSRFDFFPVEKLSRPTTFDRAGAAFPAGSSDETGDAGYQPGFRRALERGLKFFVGGHAAAGLGKYGYNSAFLQRVIWILGGRGLKLSPSVPQLAHDCAFSLPGKKPLLERANKVTEELGTSTAEMVRIFLAQIAKTGKVPLNLDTKSEWAMRLPDPWSTCRSARELL